MAKVLSFMYFSLIMARLFSRGGKTGKFYSITHPVHPVEEKKKMTFVTSNNQMQRKPQLVLGLYGPFGCASGAQPVCSMSLVEMLNEQCQRHGKNKRDIYIMLTVG